jgi:hypothetical protein
MLAAKKQLDITKEQGAQAISLVESAKVPAPAAPSGSVGRLLNITA